MWDVYTSTFWYFISSHFLLYQIKLELSNIETALCFKHLFQVLIFLQRLRSLFSKVTPQLPNSINDNTSQHSHPDRIASKDLNRSKFTNSHLILIRLYEFISLRITKFTQTKVYAHSLQEQEWHGHWQVPAASLAWADMLSNPILVSADLPITAVHERSDLSFVITTLKNRLMSLFPFCWISVASSTCSFPWSVRTIFIRVIQKAGIDK